MRTRTHITSVKTIICNLISDITKILGKVPKMQKIEEKLYIFFPSFIKHSSTLYFPPYYTTHIFSFILPYFLRQILIWTVGVHEEGKISTKEREKKKFLVTMRVKDLQTLMYNTPSTSNRVLLLGWFIFNTLKISVTI